MLVTKHDTGMTANVIFGIFFWLHMSQAIKRVWAALRVAAVKALGGLTRLATPGEAERGLT